MFTGLTVIIVPSQAADARARVWKLLNRAESAIHNRTDYHEARQSSLTCSQPPPRGFGCARGDRRDGHGIWWLGIDHGLHGSDRRGSRMVALGYQSGLCLLDGRDGNRGPVLGAAFR